MKKIREIHAWRTDAGEVNIQRLGTVRFVKQKVDSHKLVEEEKVTDNQRLEKIRRESNGQPKIGENKKRKFVL